MFTNRWVTFESYCVLSFIMGMHYHSIYTELKPPMMMIEEFSIYKYEYLYTLLYLILVPVFFNIIWKYFYWSNIIAWACIVTVLCLKFFFPENSSAKIACHLLLITSTSLVLPGSGVLASKYFSTSQYYFVLTFSSLSHIIGIVLGQIANDNIDPELLAAFQANIAAINMAVFVIFANGDLDEDTEYCKDFGESMRILFRDHDNRILFFTISAQIAIIYCSSIEFYNLYFLLFRQNFPMIYFQMVLFCVMAIFGGFISLFALKKVQFFGIMARLYIGIPFLLIFLLNFVFHGPVFYTILAIVTGATMLPSIGILQVILLNMHKDIYQPISINLSYYFTSVFMVIFILISRFLYISGFHASWGYNTLQLLILASFLSVYEHDAKTKLIKRQNTKV